MANRKGKRMRSVQAPKGEDTSIVISKERMLQIDRSARREVRIATQGQRQTGSGVHGGSDRQNNRRDRQRTNQELRRVRDSGGRSYD